MNLKEGALYIAALSFFAGAIFAYFYESRYTNWLPVITYPFRAYAVPLTLGGLVLLFLALIVGRFGKAKGKTPIHDAELRIFMLAFLVAGLVMKILGEVVHELLGHGAFVALFGGQVTELYIGLLWPYEFSYIGYSMPNATLDQLVWVMRGGILVSTVVSILIQIFLLLKQLRWQFSVPLFWLSFWCFISASGYLVIGGVLPFGDVQELIRLGALTPSLAIMIGATLFLAGFFTLSDILRKILSPFLKEKTRWGMLTFWFIIPALVGLTMMGRGMFHFLLVAFGFIPILLSFLLEFWIKSKRD